MPQQKEVRIRPKKAILTFKMAFDLKFSDLKLFDNLTQF